ncbi:MAG: bifunctional helix-turn-helix domain-containing protein/methylated-DNA--[protein]-cysteine S-methyltransferase [Pseudomonadota bacterium]
MTTQSTLTPETRLSLNPVDYDWAADMLELLGDSWRDWPNLNELARQAGLSPAHFQKKFTQWAGLSPRQYQAMLAHAEAGARLKAGESVLDVSYEVGLSGPSRLHDLFIAHEALSPGEAKSGGKMAGLTIGKARTPFGMGVWLTSERGLVALGFVDEDAPERSGFEHQGRKEADAFQDLISRYPNADIRRDDQTAEQWSQKAFETDDPLPIALYGTPFRRQIWRALIDIPFGQTVKYGELAKLAGHPKAARAVGAAVGANPISWFIPCHRALSSDQRLHNYHWGVRRKRAMLVYELAQATI